MCNKSSGPYRNSVYCSTHTWHSNLSAKFIVHAFSVIKVQFTTVFLPVRCGCGPSGEDKRSQMSQPLWTKYLRSQNTTKSKKQLLWMYYKSILWTSLPSHFKLQPPRQHAERARETHTTPNHRRTSPARWGDAAALRAPSVASTTKREAAGVRKEVPLACYNMVKK